MFSHEVCPDKHTPQTPNKDRARRWGIGTSDREGAIITISPGALGALQWMNWRGPVLVCDICRPCIQAADRMSRYYDLDISAYNVSVQRMAEMFCFTEKRPKLSVVDVDLAFALPKALPILNSVLRTLIENKVHTRVLLTYVNHRDGFGRNGNGSRASFLRNNIPLGAKHVDTFTYASGWSDEHHQYSKGSAMAVADIRT